VRKLTYLTAFTVVGLSCLAFTTTWLVALRGIDLYGAWSTIPEMFGHPVPFMVRQLVPYSSSLWLALALAVLVLRRCWLMARSRSLSPPTSYVTWLHVVTMVGVVFLLAGVIVMIASMLLSAGSGVPGGMLLVPATTLLLPPAVAVVEVWSVVHQLRGR
jgi:hypothetical protein